MKDLGRCKTMQFSIDLIDETPIYRSRHRLNKHEWELVDERCNELHEAGLIQPLSFWFRDNYSYVNKEGFSWIMEWEKDVGGL
jgi:hypothetical protein